MLSTLSIAICIATYVSGDLINDPEDVFAIDVTSGQFLILGLEAASSAIDIEIYFQNSSSSNMLWMILFKFGT